jgi:hypothetical protein
MANSVVIAIPTCCVVVVECCCGRANASLKGVEGYRFSGLLARQLFKYILPAKSMVVPTVAEFNVASGADSGCVAFRDMTRSARTSHFEKLPTCGYH